MESKNNISKEVKSNKVSHGEMVVPIIFVVVFIAIGLYGVINGEMSYRTAGKTAPFNEENGVFLQGLSCYLVSAAAITFALGMISHIIDYYDQRNNEGYYKKILLITKYLGISLYVAGILVSWSN